MSFDYDRLRELVDEATPGPWRADDVARCECCTHVEAPAASVCTADMYDAPLIALAPDMARELLCLRDGLVHIRSELDALAGLFAADGYYSQAAHVRECADRLTDLLNGDTE